MRTTELEYSLPDELIAQHPIDARDQSRMLVVDRAKGEYHEDVFKNVVDYLNTDDCIVVNETRVIRARLRGHKSTGGAVELFMLKELADGQWEALVRPSARVKPGTSVEIGGGVSCVVKDALPGGRRRVAFGVSDVLSVLERCGEIPLPPYVQRDEQDHNDLARYQTVYAREHGAVAAPTAGLHFTDDVLQELDRKGVSRAGLVLHVGYGTFKPIQVDELSEHRVDSEEFELLPSAVAELNNTRARGGRVMAVGTTSTRVLETQYRDGAYHAGEGSTDTYIYPPYQFRGVDILQTNFHLPKSSLLALVCAFAGKDLVMDAYSFAVSQKFRFYSYGDVMLLL